MGLEALLNYKIHLWLKIKKIIIVISVFFFLRNLPQPNNNGQHLHLPDGCSPGCARARTCSPGRGPARQMTLASPAARHLQSPSYFPASSSRSGKPCQLIPEVIFLPLQGQAAVGEENQGGVHEYLSPRHRVQERKLLECQGAPPKSCSVDPR